MFVCWVCVLFGLGVFGCGDGGFGFFGGVIGYLGDCFVGGGIGDI